MQCLACQLVNPLSIKKIPSATGTEINSVLISIRSNKVRMKGWDEGRRGEKDKNLKKKKKKSDKNLRQDLRSNIRQMQSLAGGRTEISICDSELEAVKSALDTCFVKSSLFQ